MKTAMDVKIAAVSLLVILALVVMLQNIQAVATKVLFVTVTMPHALLLLVCLGIGFAAGLITAGTWRKKK